MTVSELYNQVAGLGFEASLESDSRFLHAANRAMLQVNALRPATKLYRLIHAPLKNIVNEDSLSPIQRTEDLVFTATGAKSYYFECNGIGVADVEYLENGEWKLGFSIPLSSPDRSYVPYSGFIKNNGAFFDKDSETRIVFRGDFVYTVQNVAMYKDIYSNSADDIPAFSAYTAYDIGSLAKDFLRLAPASIIGEDNRDVMGDDAYAENGRIVFIARDKLGTYLVRYYTKPSKLADNESVTSEKVIELDSDLCALLPNLIASYIWAEDEPNLAEYYLNMYYKQAAELEARSRHIGTANITNNGW